MYRLSNVWISRCADVRSLYLCMLMVLIVVTQCNACYGNTTTEKRSLSLFPQYIRCTEPRISAAGDIITFRAKIPVVYIENMVSINKLDITDWCGITRIIEYRLKDDVFNTIYSYGDQPGSGGYPQRAEMFGQVSLSSDGGYAIFETQVEGMWKKYRQAQSIYAYNSELHSLALESTSNDGMPLPLLCSSPYISQNGKFSIFSAEGRLKKDDKFRYYVVVRDRIHNANSFIGEGSILSCSRSGMYVLFKGHAIPKNNDENIPVARGYILYDVAKASYKEMRLPSDVSSLMGNPGCRLQLCDDGATIAILSTGPEQTSQVYLFDSANGIVLPVSKNAEGAMGNNNSGDARVVISADGTRIAFDSFASNLDKTDTNNQRDIYLYDCRSKTATCITSYITSADISSITVDGSFDMTSDGSRICLINHLNSIVVIDINKKTITRKNIDCSSVMLGVQTNDSRFRMHQ